MLYWYNWFSWWWAWGCSKHVKNWNKYIEKNCASCWSLSKNYVISCYVTLSLIHIPFVFGTTLLHISSSPTSTVRHKLFPSHISYWRLFTGDDSRVNGSVDSVDSTGCLNRLNCASRPGGVRFELGQGYRLFWATKWDFSLHAGKCRAWTWTRPFPFGLQIWPTSAGWVAWRRR